MLVATNQWRGQFPSIQLDVIRIKNVQFTCDVIRLVSKQFDLLLIRFQDTQTPFDFLELDIHVVLGGTDQPTDARECSAQFPGRGVGEEKEMSNEKRGKNERSTKTHC